MKHLDTWLRAVGVLPFFLGAHASITASNAERWARRAAKTLVCLVAACSSWSWGAATSLTGQLDPANPQDVFLYPFTLSAPATVTVQSWGYGGTLSAPGGTNANGAVIPPGGFDPYVSLFSGTGSTATFVASNDDGLCPPGTVAAGSCFDSTLTRNLQAGAYTLAVSSFLNMSLAENYGTGNLGDGFVALGSFGVRSNAFAVDITGPAVVTPTRALGFIPNALTFGPQTLNTTSGPMTVVITSVGTAPVTTGLISAGGTNAAEFTAAGNCASTVLAPGASCALSVSFRPTALGSRSAAITLNSDAGNNPLLVNVSGAGTSSAVAGAGFSATDLDFGGVVFPASSTPQALIVTNIGGAPLTIGADVLGGANAGDFTLTDACTGKTINPGNNCAVTIVFRPQALGPRSATLTFNSNASNNPVTVTLRGAGVAMPVVPIPALTNWSLLLLSLMLGLTACLGSGLALPWRHRSVPLIARRLRLRNVFKKGE